MSEHWTQYAACRDTMLELWFGPEGYAEPKDQSRWRQRRAAEVCAMCPVRTECLAEELMRPIREQHGIRGGLTPRARERLLARWRQTGHVPEDRPPDGIETVRRLLEKHEQRRDQRIRHG
ncbi:WhiB family transcriptional regulator [Saccharopolyspora sp. NPDC049426]|uniref:WhiB family transcriptional regulator n=1 Tax=Saccharopolyspora sp. NPDC049426 TaxID=3155652 RepID=UPI00342D695A